MSELTLPQGDPSPWLTAQAAADYMGIGVGTVYKLAARRAVRHARVGFGERGLLRFKREWLDEFLSQSAVVEIAPKGRS